MNIVADTNIFIAAALDEPEKGGIVRRTKGHALVAPDVLPFELGNALTAMMRKGILRKEEMIAAWDIVQQIPVDLRPTNVRSALQIAARFHIYAYDAYFLECAGRMRCPLLTLDSGMKRIAGELGMIILE